MKNLKEGLGIKIANGAKTDTILDPWIEGIPIRWWPTFVDIKAMEMYKVVANLMNADGWCADKLNRCFGKELVNKIEAIQCDVEGAEDTWVWRSDLRGQLTIKNAYCYLKDKENEYSESDSNWRKLWSVKISERVKIFDWKLI
ncbi:hypothetical protein Cni_G28894 [Canna indica]|uniref:Reverse transcriptase zinc-binding domain-containing protein n=1 Tax=Canna indica TaxID=4628 RepID=A0AAQ3L6A2_9LILI|nr:hypothetical protein Cni_G28894 [Canna indica]